MTLPLYAELTGSSICAAAGIAAHGNAPVLALCRRLVEAGHDPSVGVFGSAMAARLAVLRHAAQRAQAQYEAAA